jgi:hypothetical protein
MPGIGPGIGGNQGDTLVILALQELIKASFLTQQTLANGLPITFPPGWTVATLAPPASTVALLPAVHMPGQLAYATNGCGPGQLPGQLVGTGTGCLCVANASGWTAVWSGSAVSA